MKMLVDRTDASTAAPFDLEQVKTYLRVTHNDEDTAIAQMAWTAAREIEHFAQIALLHQTIRVMIFGPWRDYALDLPVGPASEGDTPTVTIDGEPFTDLEFVSGARPYLRWLDSYHGLTPGRMVVEYQAGFGAAASDIPHDLAQAIMDQTALHYDGRSPMDAKSLTTSPHMARVGARYRGVAI